ncbi:MAG: hypothetical protein PVH84_02505 [Candidatus Aminicenantes bacterium]|jgi:hypothetical protein
MSITVVVWSPIALPSDPIAWRSKPWEGLHADPEFVDIEFIP